jgi:hypothetical protein
LNYVDMDRVGTAPGTMRIIGSVNFYCRELEG